MNIGELYASVLGDMNAEIVTVDLNPLKGADFLTVEAALSVHKTFDTVNICTPNSTHLAITQQVAPYSQFVFVEKPGFATAEEWQSTVLQFPLTRIMMVKNNQWRDDVHKMKTLANKSHIVNINWIRKDCVPNPGSWFTTKELAYGGVSRDLMPHLLSLYIILNPEWHTSTARKSVSSQQWQLEDIHSTDYGTVNPSGTYDVDDYATLNYGSKWCLTANWRSLSTDESCIKTYTRRGSSVLTDTIDLGWCPESAFYTMIKSAINNKDNNHFWQTQAQQDTWIHKQLELL